MVLSKKEILEYLADKRLRFDPEIDPANIEQVSIDLRLGRKFTRFRKTAKEKYVGALRVDASLFQADLWENFEQDTFVLDPGSFVLAQTLEKVTLPNDLVGLVEGRSSWARTGVSVHVTAPKIDPTFSAVIALEMTNLSPHPILLRAGEDKPCQLMLLRTSSPIPDEDAYGTKDTHTFQGQDSPIPRAKS